MKQFLITLMGLIIIGCNKQEIVITIDVQDQPDIDMLIYSVPMSGTMYQGFIDSLKVNETGKFEVNLTITCPSFVTIFDKSNTNRVKLLLEQGNNYYVSMMPQKNIQITGANEKGQMLYTTLPNPTFVEMELMKWLANNDAPFISVHHQINDLKQADLTKFKELLDNNEITKSYFDLIQKDRDCYYASLEARFLIIKSSKSYQLRFGNDEDNLSDYLKDIYEQYPPNDKSLLFSSFWPEYAMWFIEEYKQRDFDIMKIRDEGMYNTHIINESKNYLSGKSLEFFQARYLHFESYNGTFKGNFNYEFVSLFEQFEKDYPQSEYSKYIKPYIEEIINFRQIIIDKPYNPAMLFMNNYENINTLEEAIKPLRGKKIYIDVWATWCGPCKREFEHNEALKVILAENDVQQLYISIDSDEKDQQWKYEIKYYHLLGTHIRTNKELYYDLMKQFDKNAATPYIAIPWYILVDETGNIIEEHTKRPSELVSGVQLFAND